MSVHHIRARGIMTLAGIADELTRQKWSTARGAENWSMIGDVEHPETNML
jgi:hypothetical protein